jgi:hypothetical protein
MLHFCCCTALFFHFGSDTAFFFNHVGRSGFMHLLLLLIVRINRILLILNDFDAFLTLGHFGFLVQFLNLGIIQLVMVGAFLTFFSFAFLLLVHKFLRKKIVKG